MANSETSIPALPLRAQVLDDNGFLTRPWITALQGFTKTGAAAAGVGTTAGGGPASVTTIRRTLSSASTIIVSGVTAPADGQCLAVELLQDPTGGRAITWDVDFSPDTTTDISPTGLTRFVFIFYGGFWKCHAFYAQP